MKNLSFLNKIFFILNTLAVFTLLLSYLAYYVSPDTFFPLAFFSLAAPLLYLINLLFVLFWLMQAKKQILLSLLALLLGWNYINRTITINFNEPSPESTDSSSVFKLISYNVRYFDVYDWIDKSSTKEKIFDLIKEEKPDIICFQEFYHSTGKNTYLNDQEVIENTDSEFSHIEDMGTFSKNEKCGIATFSKFPIINKGKISFGAKENNVCIYSDIIINDDTIRVYNIHMASIAFAPKDYKFIDDIAENKETDEVEGSKGILKRLKKAFLKRTKQAEQVAEHIKECPYKLIICGDFNDTPSSYAYKTVAKNLSDAFTESGNGLGKSYIGKFPSFRIDYILHSKELKPYEFITHSEKLSDHRAISCLFEVF